MIEIRDQLLEIESIYDKHIKRIKDLLDLGYKEEAVILTVTIFEVFFRDLFRVTKQLWFTQYPCGSVDCLPITEGIEARKKIQDYLQSIKAYDEFLGHYYVFERSGVYPTRDSIFATIFDENDKMNYLNFQLLNENKGVRDAYRIFFDIDIMMNLDDDTNVSQQKWTKLIKMFKDRHAIIHKGKDTGFSKEDVIELLDSLDFLKSKVMERILTPYSGSIK
jgi:hypothetical protein